MRTLVRIWSTVFPEGIIKQETLGAVELYNSMESSKGEKAEGCVCVCVRERERENLYELKRRLGKEKSSKLI